MKANAHFWEQMLSMKLERTLFPEQFCVAAGHMVGRVTLSGEWQGRIEVRMAGGLAYEATIAGAIKSSLPRPCSMTVPESAVENECFCGEARRQDTLVVAFRHPAGDLMVRVWERECNAQ
jgi:hypothetical protein